MSRGDEFEAGQPPSQPRQDEFGAGLPPARPRMSDAGDDELGDDRDVRRPEKRGRSGAVTAVGIIAIVLGCLVLLGAICTAVTPMVSKQMLDFAAKANPNDPNVAKQRQMLDALPQWYFILMGGIEFLRAVGLVGGGLGVVKRVNAARWLVIALACIGVILLIVGSIASFAMGAVNVDDPASMAGGVCGLVFSAILNLGFAAMALFVLLSAKNAAEFRS